MLQLGSLLHLPKEVKWTLLICWLSLLLKMTELHPVSQGLTVVLLSLIKNSPVLLRRTTPGVLEMLTLDIPSFKGRHWGMGRRCFLPDGKDKQWPLGALSNKYAMIACEELREFLNPGFHLCGKWTTTLGCIWFPHHLGVRVIRVRNACLSSTLVVISSSLGSLEQVGGLDHSRDLLHRV